jgi:Leucine-rich repeat (LRR) protein
MPIYAVAFTPENFEPKLLANLKGLPNLRQVQLSGTQVTDGDLKELVSLRMLTGVGLDNTAITDAGLLSLAPLPYLTMVEHEGTSISENALNRVLKAVP